MIIEKTTYTTEDGNVYGKKEYALKHRRILEFIKSYEGMEYEIFPPYGVQYGDRLAEWIVENKMMVLKLLYACEIQEEGK